MLYNRWIRRTSKWVFVGLILMILIFYLNMIFSTEKNYNFVMENTPYRNLENAECRLQGYGQWKCPDIRKLGKSKLRQTQLVLTRMLLVFDALAKKHGLRYWITRATLLGAARHQGHIPWDTDLDIEMPIEDYFEFVRKAAAELPAGLTLQHHKAEAQFLHIELNNTYYTTTDKQVLVNTLKPYGNPRLRDDGSCYGTCLTDGCSWHDGLMIDVFPVSLSNGYYSIQFAHMITSVMWKLIGYRTEFRAFPLRDLKFEGYHIPVPYDWKQFLMVYYGQNYMQMPSHAIQRPSGNILPEPLHSCSELKKIRNIK